jgi:hypothetical protein
MVVPATSIGLPSRNKSTRVGQIPISLFVAVILAVAILIFEMSKTPLLLGEDDPEQRFHPPIKAVFVPTNLCDAAVNRLLECECLFVF